ncbi:hypothetical protein KFE25_007089 [Diacronema lutheri]|uniref:Transmembrane protein n=1 Tax=Diacronema lutheri TaxID=2081491 RepID=A0A8J6CAV1_DIALT|nr:hypothetical protein KFE25_007089 [Diacronema lutheri]
MASLPTFARTSQYDPIRVDQFEDEDEEGDSASDGDEGEEDEVDAVHEQGAEGRLHAAPLAMTVVDWLLLAFACGMIGLFVLIARQVALAIFVALLCVGVCAYAFVSAQMSTGPARWLSALVCALSVATFVLWSVKFVFYMPESRATRGCGGVFWENMTNNMDAPRARDEL